MQNKYNIEPYGEWLVQAEGSLPNGYTYSSSCKNDVVEVIVYRGDNLAQIVLFDSGLEDASKYITDPKYKGWTLPKEGVGIWSDVIDLYINLCENMIDECCKKLNTKTND